VFQLYLLTVLTNILVGLALAREFLGSRFGRFSKLTGFADSGGYQIVLAVVSILVGVINLFPIYVGNTAVLGDFLPSLAGIGAGFLLLMEYSRSRKDITKTEGTEATQKTGKISGPFSTIIGICSIIIGILHALIPKAPLF